MGLKIVRPPTIARILQITDALGIHREAVRIPLAPVAEGTLRIEKQVLVVEVPEEPALEPYLGGIAERIRVLPGAELLKRAD